MFGLSRHNTGAICSSFLMPRQVLYVRGFDMDAESSSRIQLTRHRASPKHASPPGFGLQEVLPTNGTYIHAPHIFEFAPPTEHHISPLCTRFTAPSRPPRLPIRDMQDRGQQQHTQGTRRKPFAFRRASTSLALTQGTKRLPAHAHGDSGRRSRLALLCSRARPNYHRASFFICAFVSRSVGTYRTHSSHRKRKYTLTIPFPPPSTHTQTQDKI